MVRLSLFSLVLLAAASLSAATSEVQYLRALQGGDEDGPGGNDNEDPPGGEEDPETPGGEETPETPDGEETPEAPEGDVEVPMVNGTVAEVNATAGPEAESGPADNTTEAPVDAVTPVPTDAVTGTNGTDVPTDVDGTAAPVDTNGTAAPVDTNGTATPMDVNDTAAPMDVNDTAVPVNEEIAAPGFDIVTVFEVIANDTDLAILASVVNVSGIDDVLPVDENYTVFAPTNEAILQLDPALVAKLQTPNWGAHLSNLLTFHVVSGTVLSSDLTDGMVVQTLNMENITIGVGETVTITSTFSNESTVTQADLLAGNGVVHKIDSVLLPDWVGTNLIGLANTTQGQDFSTLFELINLLDLGASLDLAGDVTVFAPTNAAFDALPEGALDNLRNNTAELTRILTNHVLSNINPSALVSDGLAVKSFGGMYDLVFSVNGTEVKVNDANIVVFDVLANNGIVHAIDKVLLEPFVADNTTDPDPQPEPSPMATPTDKETDAPVKSPVSPALPTAPTASTTRSSATTVSMVVVSAVAVLACLV